MVEIGTRPGLRVARVRCVSHCADMTKTALDRLVDKIYSKQHSVKQWLPWPFVCAIRQETVISASRRTCKRTQLKITISGVGNDDDDCW